MEDRHPVLLPLHLLERHFPLLLWKLLVVTLRQRRTKGNAANCKKQGFPTPSCSQVKAARSHSISSASPRTPGTCFKKLICVQLVWLSG